MFFEDSQTIETRESCSSIVPKKNVTTTFNVKTFPWEIISLTRTLLRSRIQHLTLIKLWFWYTVKSK